MSGHDREGGRQFPGTFQTPPGDLPDHERSLYSRLFYEAGGQQLPNGPGEYLAGAHAIVFLRKSRLDDRVLGEIWAIVDSEKRGMLNKLEFAHAMRLVAHAQAGCVVSRGLIQAAPASSPNFGEPCSSVASSSAGRGRSPGPRPSMERPLPSARDLRKYGRLFCRIVGRGDPSARMSGEAAHDLFGRSGQPNEVLQRVWQLADADRDGNLTWPEFVVAMHHVRAVRVGSSVPETRAGLAPGWEIGLNALERADLYAAHESRSPRSMSARSSPFSSVSKFSRPSTPRRLTDRSEPTSKDLKKYGRLFCKMSGPNGFISADDAHQLLIRSDLPDGALQQIWAHADVDQDGQLNWQEFVLAMHLVRRLRSESGWTLPGAGAPPDLMAFLGQLASAETYASQGTTRSPSPTSDLPRSQSGTSRSRSSTPRRLADHSEPTPRDLRKYGRLFCRLAGASGIISADDGRHLLIRSGLPDEALQQIWAHSDVDQDGQLNWQEFVLAMHLVRRLRSGSGWKLPEGGAPPDLIAFLSQLRSAETYASQGSPRTPSSGSELFPSQPATPRSHSRGKKLPRTAQSTETMAWSDDSMVVQSQPDLLESQCSGSLGSKPKVGGCPTMHVAEPFPNEETVNREAALQNNSEFGTPLRSREQTSRHALPDGRLQTSLETSVSGKGNHLGNNLEVLTEEENHIAQKLRLDIDALDEELTRLEEDCRFEQRQMAREQAESHRIEMEWKRLLHELEASKHQLVTLKEEHWSLHAECVALQRNHGHYGQEIACLKRLYDEGVRDTVALQHAIDFLEQSRNSLTEHTRSLQDAQQEIQLQTRTEQEQLQRERLETDQAKQELEALKGGNFELSGLAPIVGNGGKLLPHTPGTGERADSVTAMQRSRPFEDLVAQTAGQATAPPGWQRDISLTRSAGIRSGVTRALSLNPVGPGRDRNPNPGIRPEINQVQPPQAPFAMREGV